MLGASGEALAVARNVAGACSAQGN